MALIPLAARHTLTRFAIDFDMRLPKYRHETNVRGLITVSVTFYVGQKGAPISEQTFTSTPEDSLIIAEDIASRLALRFLQAYYAADQPISAYFNRHVFKRSKTAWITSSDRLAQQLDIARDKIRKLHDKVYQATLNYNNQAEKFKQAMNFEAITTAAHMRELSDENATHKCKIIFQENRIQYLERMNMILSHNRSRTLELPSNHQSPAPTVEGLHDRTNDPSIEDSTTDP